MSYGQCHDCNEYLTLEEFNALHKTRCNYTIPGLCFACLGKRAAVVDKLPKTADGVSVNPDMALWIRTVNGPICGGLQLCFGGSGGLWNWLDVYSTRAAAEQAREREK